MSNINRSPITDPSQIPADMTEDEARKFWDSHEITEEYVEKVGTISKEQLPKFRPRTKPISVRLDEDTLRRLKRLARIKNKGYQTLLKEFVVERLYQEERREGVVSASEGEASTFSKHIVPRSKRFQEPTKYKLLPKEEHHDYTSDLQLVLGLLEPSKGELTRSPWKTIRSRAMNRSEPASIDTSKLAVFGGAQRWQDDERQEGF